jgi:hypothetical protein
MAKDLEGPQGYLLTPAYHVMIDARGRIDIPEEITQERLAFEKP